MTTNYSCALYLDGDLRCFGGRINGHQRKRFDGRIDDFAVTSQGGGCAAVDGRVWCWGAVEPLRAAMTDDEWSDHVETSIARAYPYAELFDRVVIGSELCGMTQSRELVCLENGQRWKPRSALRDVNHLVAVPGSNQCAVASGQVWCWGTANQVGQLGVGSLIQSVPDPVRLTGLDAVDSLSLTETNGCARQRGEWWCWGQADLLNYSYLRAHRVERQP